MRFKSLLTTLALVAVVGAGVWGGSAFAQDRSDPSVLGEGQIGRSAWAVWLEGAAGKAGPSLVCVGIALARPSVAGLVARSESRECVSVGEDEPVLESITGGKGKKRRTVWAMLFAPSVARIYLNIGDKGGRMVQTRQLSRRVAERLEIEQLSYFRAGYAGSACLRRLITYGAGGERLSDTRGACA